MQQTPEEALARLLSSLFDLEELLTWLSLVAELQALVEDVPGAQARPATVYASLVHAMRRRGLIAAPLFLALIRERPRRAAEIRRVALHWGITLSDADAMTAQAMGQLPRPQSGSPGRRPLLIIAAVLALVGGGVAHLKTRTEDSETTEPTRVTVEGTAPPSSGPTPAPSPIPQGNPSSSNPHLPEPGSATVAVVTPAATWTVVQIDDRVLSVQGPELTEGTVLRLDPARVAERRLSYPVRCVVTGPAPGGWSCLRSDREASAEAVKEEDILVRNPPASEVTAP